jgi:hypothetical protein
MIRQWLCGNWFPETWLSEQSPGSRGGFFFQQQIPMQKGMIVLKDHESPRH